MKADSSLVDCVIYSPNNSGQRVYPLTRISVHCVVGQCLASSLGNLFSNSGFEASSNYGIGYDGSIGQYVPEAYRSWCTSSYDNDERAITIEVASDTYDPYKVTSAAYSSLIKLLVDICKRNKKKKLLWFGDKEKSLSYSPKSDELVMTVHRWFCSYKSCPGDYLYNLHGTIAKEVTKQLGGSTNITDPVDMRFYTAAKTGYTYSSVQVKTLQRLLNSLGFKDKNNKELSISGKFDDATEYAVKKYQKKYGLEVDGIVGKETWKLITGGKG